MLAEFSFLDPVLDTSQFSQQLAAFAQAEAVLEPWKPGFRTLLCSHNKFQPSWLDSPSKYKGIFYYPPT